MAAKLYLEVDGKRTAVETLAQLAMATELVDFVDDIRDSANSIANNPTAVLDLGVYGGNAIDYACAVADRFLVGQKFTVRRLADLMLKAGWKSKAKDFKLQIKTVRQALQANRKYFKQCGGGVWEYDKDARDSYNENMRKLVGL